MMARRVAKLRAMPVREVAQRLAYGAYTAVERQRHSRGAFARPGRLRRSLVSNLRRSAGWEDALLERRSAARFFAWQDDAAGLRDLLQRHYPGELQKAREIAGQAARHEIAFFGETFQFGPRIDWHTDPVTGAQWPRRYHRDVDCSSKAGCGDIKHVWELNRHQFLMDLAKVSFADASTPHAAEVLSVLDSWMDAAPYGTGTPWACALEPAFRVWSWLWAYHMLLAAGLLPPAAHLRWLAGFLDHGRFLHRHMEHYTSPYNHLVGEASALFAVGLAFPEFSESRQWVRQGRRVLEATLPTQFHADGGSVEQSTFYHHATLGFYMLSAVLGRRHGEEFGDRTWSAIERGLEFSIALTQPNGRVPSIGGADDGKPIRLEHLPFWDFRPYHAIGAVLFRRPDFKAAAGRFWEDALWVLGPRAQQQFAELAAELPVTSRILPHSGYSVFRSSWSEDADYVCFDCGPQAAGLRQDDVPSAAHGHADCLSVVVTLAGQPVLVDPGFFCYNGAPDWEVYFRKTGAHNTILVDGRDQARHISKMDWTRTYTPRFEGSAPDASVGWARGSHDGYARSDGGVVHRRTVWLRPGGYVVIYDELTGQPGHSACANFQFAPGVLALESGESAVFADRFELAWTCSVAVTARVIDDGTNPSGGWIAPSLGVRKRAPKLQLDFPLSEGRVVLLTVVADRRRGAQGSRRRVAFPEPWLGDGVPYVGGTIVGAGWEDRILGGEDRRRVQWRGIDTDAAVAVVRVQGTAASDMHRIGGTMLQLAQQNLAPERLAESLHTGS